MPETTLTCPITGSAVKIAEITYGDFKSKGYIGRVETDYGGYSTCIFEHREQLVDFFNRRRGVLKGKPTYAPPKIEVKEPPLIHNVDAQERQGERDTDEAAQVGAESIMRIIRR